MTKYVMRAQANVCDMSPYVYFNYPQTDTHVSLRCVLQFDYVDAKPNIRQAILNLINQYGVKHTEYYDVYFETDVVLYIGANGIPYQSLDIPRDEFTIFKVIPLS